MFTGTTPTYVLTFGDDVDFTQAVRDKDIDDRLKVIEEKLESHNSYSKLFTEYTAKNNEVIVAIQKDIEYLKEK